MSSLSLKQIKENISIARKQSGITQEEMARLLDISQPAYSYYETGEKPIPLNKIKRICEILSIPMQELVGDISKDENGEEVLVEINKNLERIANSLDRLCEYVIRRQ
jgi:transcriptional regulator with XRE-family HTH domain